MLTERLAESRTSLGYVGYRGSADPAKTHPSIRAALQRLRPDSSECDPHTDWPTRPTQGSRRARTGLPQVRIRWWREATDFRRQVPPVRRLRDRLSQDCLDQRHGQSADSIACIRGRNRRACRQAVLRVWKATSAFARPSLRTICRNRRKTRCRRRTARPRRKGNMSRGMAGDIEHPQVQAYAGHFNGVAFPQCPRDAGNLLARRAEHRYVILRQQIGVAADVIRVMVGRQNRGEPQALVRQIIKDRMSIAGVDDNGSGSAAQTPDIVVLECADSNDGGNVHAGIFYFAELNVNRRRACQSLRMVFHAAGRASSRRRTAILRPRAR